MWLVREDPRDLIPGEASRKPRANSRQTSETRLLIVSISQLHTSAACRYDRPLASVRMMASRCASLEATENARSSSDSRPSSLLESDCRLRPRGPSLRQFGTFERAPAECSLFRKRWLIQLRSHSYSDSREPLFSDVVETARLRIWGSGVRISPGAPTKSNT
jgi:hypothetical protein